MQHGNISSRFTVFSKQLLQKQTMKNQNMIRYFERYFVTDYSSKTNLFTGRRLLYRS